MNTSEHILSMPLTELRERVELAERMALAARLTPTGTYDEGSAAVNSGAAGSSPSPAPAAAPAAEAPKRTRRTKEQIAADEAAAAAAAAAETPAAATGGDASGGMSDADLMAAMSEEPAADAGGSELSLDDIGTGDMMEGFEAAETTLSVADARKGAEAIVADIIAKKDQARLAVAREALVKVGAQKASEVPDEKIVEFYNLLPKS